MSSWSSYLAVLGTEAMRGVAFWETDPCGYLLTKQDGAD